MLRLASVFGLALLAASILAATGSGTPASSSASRIIDRTLNCEIGIMGGIRLAELRVSSAVRQRKQPANVDLTTNIAPTWRLAYVGETAVELSPACRPSTARVLLSARGLSGGIASPFVDNFDCWMPRRVLIRVRAVFRSPVTLRSGTPWGFPLRFARGEVTEGSLAIRTQAGKRLAFVTVSDSGRARVFTAAEDCFPD